MEAVGKPADEMLLRDDGACPLLLLEQFEVARVFEYETGDDGLRAECEARVRDLCAMARKAASAPTHVATTTVMNKLTRLKAEIAELSSVFVRLVDNGLELMSGVYWDRATVGVLQEPLEFIAALLRQGACGDDELVGFVQMFEFVTVELSHWLARNGLQQADLDKFLVEVRLGSFLVPFFVHLCFTFHISIRALPFTHPCFAFHTPHRRQEREGEQEPWRGPFVHAFLQKIMDGLEANPAFSGRTHRHRLAGATGVALCFRALHLLSVQVFLQGNLICTARWPLLPSPFENFFTVYRRMRRQQLLLPPEEHEDFYDALVEGAFFRMHVLLDFPA